jgi:hypothetical protein
MLGFILVILSLVILFVAFSFIIQVAGLFIIGVLGMILWQAGLLGKCLVIIIVLVIVFSSAKE